ncbi:WecB/TagA/CpsF family glycosyltransferase [Aureimonas frigidaquae]|uniref:WecB/TagA/CpsF family glycosyltransferase n=1 Tax=Aureimonas frigidaquae TaxID=424757 RepID=UPI00178C938E|nr:WecB/TagA/CpsF family glycosyltransferase [Aureimonas frigidaquae]
MNHCRILGVTIVNETMEAARRRFAELIARPGRRSLYFVNAHTLNNACADAAYRDVLRRADVVYGDGTGVRWAAKARGIRLEDNVNGTDLVPLMLQSGEGIRCFLIGSAPERIDAILAAARARFPKVTFVGAHHGYIDEAASVAVAGEVRRSGANLVLVGMGNPLQENWIDRYGHLAPDALMVAVGGLFEYWGGGLVRAPLWMRRSGIEWVHLMLRQPWKARRYLIGNPLFMGRMLKGIAADRRSDTSRLLEGRLTCPQTASPSTDGSPRRRPDWPSEAQDGSSHHLEGQGLSSAS